MSKENPSCLKINKWNDNDKTIFVGAKISAHKRLVPLAVYKIFMRRNFDTDENSFGIITTQGFFFFFPGIERLSCTCSNACFINQWSEILSSLAKMDLHAPTIILVSYWVNHTLRRSLRVEDPHLSGSNHGVEYRSGC